MKMNDTLYSILKWGCIIFLPALASLILGLSALYHWEWGEVVYKTILLVDTFLGALIGVAACNYNESKDYEVVEDEEDIEE